MVTYHRGRQWGERVKCRMKCFNETRSLRFAGSRFWWNPEITYLQIDTTPGIEPGAPNAQSPRTSQLGQTSIRSPGVVSIWRYVISGFHQSYPSSTWAKTRPAYTPVTTPWSGLMILESSCNTRPTVMLWGNLSKHDCKYDARANVNVCIHWQSLNGVLPVRECGRHNSWNSSVFVYPP